MDEQTKELYRQNEMAWLRGFNAGKMYLFGEAILSFILVALVITLNK